MNTEKLKNLVGEKLQELCDDELIELWNEYCDRFGSLDSKIFYMGEFDSKYANLKTESPEDIVRNVKKNFSDFDPDDSFFVGGDDVESFNNPKKYIDTDELVDALIEERMECAAVHIDELKKQCEDKPEFKPIENIEQLQGLVGSLHNFVYLRGKDWEKGEYMYLRFTGCSYRDGHFLISFGNVCLSAGDWFGEYELSLNGNADEYFPFGVEED